MENELAPHKGSTSISGTPESTITEPQDSLATARKKRQNQGCHECEVWPAGSKSAEGYHTWNACKKNPGHHGFIPVRQFSLKHLPKSWQSEDVLYWIWNIMALTVRLRVSTTSRERPTGYTFSDYAGLTIPHTGSGLITAIRPGEGPCTCRHCTDGKRQEKRPCWIVSVKTACHVVFNTEEAQTTLVDVFYDDLNSSINGRMKTMLGSELTDKQVDDDWCIFQCITHDADLAQRLLMYTGMRPRCKELFGYQQRISRNFKFMCVIVSHPHGCPKHVSVGKVTNRTKVRGKIDYQFIYTAPTCCGTSGAPVIFPSKVSFYNWPGWSAWTAVHSSARGGGRNESAAGTFHAYTFKPLQKALTKVGTALFHVPFLGGSVHLAYLYATYAVIAKFYIDLIP